MLKFYHGTKLENLADQLLEELHQHPQKPLSPEIFVVQNHGIGQWLSLYMARKEGIAANLEFEFPSERIWSLIRLLDPDIPQTLPSDRGPLTWTLMKLLQDKEVQSEFDQLQYYVQDEDPEQQLMRSWKLCSRIADVFDQYLIYRPNLLLDWEEGQRHYPQNEAEQWQARLWNKLRDHWDQHYDEKWLHRAKLQDDLLNALDEGRLNTDDLPDRLSVFGVSSMPPVFIDTLVKLSRLIDVHFYQLSLDPQVKESNQFQNPLLQSLTKESTGFMSHLSRCVKDHGKVADTMEWKAVDTSHSGKDSAFREVQSDLRNNIGGEEAHQKESDPTIQVHSCHSAMREVEVLYDQLLDVLDENPEINPDDILIMTPDIETYAPMIEAVFETPDEGQPEIPYSIADRISGANPAIQCFLKILELCESRFKVTDVLDLLDADPIQESFGLSEDNLNRIERWIRDNRIRWGIDGSFKQKMDLPNTESYTWRSGLNRMLLGYAMGADDDKLHDDIFPYDEIETSDDAELAGKLSRFLHSLFEISRRVDEAKYPGKWTQQLGEIVTVFLPDTRDYFWEISQVREALDQLTKHAELGGYDSPISFSIIRNRLQDQLDEQSTGGGRIGQGATFSSLMPMRSIPFKMIGMIGMNEGAFPRSKIPIEFDLMHLEPQDGDPVQSEEDRNLFLESLLSARSHLYFSYIGQSNRQDSNFPPSVILTEFLDYLEGSHGLSAENLVQKHRLQAFSPHYFTDDDYISYSQTQKKVSQQLLDGQADPTRFIDEGLSEPDEKWKKISVSELVSFFQHPAKYLLQNRLGIYLREDDVLTEDREPFTVGGLDNYKIGQELLNRFIKEKSLESYEQNLESRDMLPEGWGGNQAFRQRVNEVREFGAKINGLLDQQALEDREVDITIGDFRIVGKLSDVYEDALISYRFGSRRPKDNIALWIRHLIFQTAKSENHPGMSYFLSRDNGSFATCQLPTIENVTPILSSLLELYWEGLQGTCFFYCKSSYAYAKARFAWNKDKQYALDRAVKKWEPGYNGYPGEGDDDYNRLIAGNKKPHHNKKFIEQSTTIWKPFFKIMNQNNQ